MAAQTTAPAPDTAMTGFLSGFGEEPGYLDFAAFGPLSAAALGEAAAQQDALRRARPGAWDRLQGGTARLAAAASDVTGFRADQIVFQPSTTEGLTQALYGVTGQVLLSPGEYPSLTTAAARAEDVLQTVVPVRLPTTAGRVTPGGVREALTPSVVAVAVSAVDARTGYAADLDGIRQVIGDRLLIVDAVQALGAADSAWGAADVIACGGQKWLRAGYGCAFLAVSDRAAERLTPALSGIGGTGHDDLVWDEVPPPASGAAGLLLAHPDQAAAARLAAALEDLASAGPAAVAARVAHRAAQVLALADEFGLPVVSPRADGERAGIVVLEPLPERLTALTAALHNHGVSVTIRDGRVRIAPHAGTLEETLGMLRAAFTAYAQAVRPVR